MATFGNTNAEASTRSIRNNLYGDQFNLPENGDVTSITAYVRLASTAGDTSALVTCAIYDSSGNFIDNTEEKLITNTSFSWVTFNFSSPASLTAGDYQLFAAGSDDADNPAMADVTSNPGTGLIQASFGYGTFPDPHSAGSFAGEPSIYATYTPTATSRRIIIT